MKRQLTSILLFSALLMGGASTFVSCKDYESDVNYETNAKMDQAFKDYAKQLNTVNDALEQFKRDCKQCGCDNDALLAEVDRRIEANKVVLDGYLKADGVNQILQDGKYLKAGDLKTEDIKNLLILDKDFKEAIDASKAYKNYINNILYNTGGISDSLKIAYDNANKALDAIYGTKETPGLTEKVSDLQTKLEEVKLLAKDDSVRIDELAEEVQDYVDASIDEVIDMIPTDEHINDLTNAKLQDYYTKTQIDFQIEGILEQVTALQESIWDILENQVSGIIVQASESPLTGYENTPFGVQVGILGAYYGNGSFTDYAGNKIAGNVVLDDANNAGTLYVTVNPANVNPTAITLRLVDSQGNIIGSSNAADKAPFSLEWANTSRVLKFGAGRAVEQTNNGFYAVNVKLNNDAEAIAEAKTWVAADKENLKAAAKNILEKLRHPKSSNLELGKIASTLNSTFNNRLTAYGLEASWQQLGPDGELMDKKVTSKLSLAATAVSPLGFTFLQDGINVDLPTIPTLESKGFKFDHFNWTPVAGMDDMKVKTSVTIENVPTGGYTIDGTITPVANIVENYPTRATQNADGTFTVDLTGLEVKIGDLNLGENIHITLEKENITRPVEITVPMDDFNRIINDINSQVGNMIGSVNDIVDKVNHYSDYIDGNIINRINSYIKKFENLLTKSNSLLQPAMFYVADNGNWGQLPKVEEAAAQLKLNGGVAQTVFIASSYTAELLAPAYQKQITVDGGAQITGTEANGVLKGNKYKVGFKATKPGTYTITYNAVDYFGNKTSKKFYVKVVE